MQPLRIDCSALIHIYVMTFYFLYLPYVPTTQLRTLFLEYGLQTVDGIACGSIIKKIYDSELQQSSRLLPKLTDTHFNYDTFQKMRVYLATQVLSNSCSSAIEQMLEKGFFSETDIPKAKASALFCKKMNDLFDLMNAKTEKDENPLKRGISIHTINYLKEIKEYVHSFKQIKGNTVYCINGIKLTINAAIGYYEENCRRTGVVLLTRCLNQDPLENLFGEIRQQNHNSSNPYLLDFLRILSRIITTKFDMETRHRNVEWDQSCELSLIDLNQFKKGEKLIEDKNEKALEIKIDKKEEDEWEEYDWEEVCNCLMCLLMSC